MKAFKDILEANKLINTTELKTKTGVKNYAEVPQRVKAFRSLYPEGKIETDIVTYDDNFVLMRCNVYTEEGELLATGHAMEEKSGSFINKTSYIENCETSAVGRALGFLALGSDTSIASFEEVANAINTQEAKKYTPEANKRVETPESAPYVPKEMAELKRKVNEIAEKNPSAFTLFLNNNGWKAGEITQSRYRMEQIISILGGLNA